MTTVKFRRAGWLGALGLALLHAGLAFDIARQKTPTVDEIAHLPAGLSYLETGDFRAYRLSPPFARMAPALAARPLQTKLDFTGTWKIHQPMSHWLFAFEYLNANSADDMQRQRYLESFTRARAVVVALSALTTLLIYAWGVWWFGVRAGLLAAGFWALSPNILAHGSLMTTDLACTSAMLAASFALAGWLERATWPRFVLVSLLLGVAQLVKFSSLLLYPVFLAWIVCDSLFWRASPEGWWARLRSLAVRLALWLGMSLGSVVVINAGYGFGGLFTPLEKFAFVSDGLTRPRLLRDGVVDQSSNRAYLLRFQERVNKYRGTWLGKLPVPLPFHYVAGFDEQKFEADGKYAMYFRGEFAKDGTFDKRRGWVVYYVYALLVKEPVSVWLMGCIWVASVLLGCGPPGRRWAPIALLGLAPIAVMSLLTDINLGVRYVLPALPMLYLWFAASMTNVKYSVARLCLAVGLGWSLLTVIRIHPHELSYFNELAGPPARWRLELIDSNLDWGQDLRGLAKWVRRHPAWASDVRLAYWGTVPPEFEGIERYRLAPRDIRQIPDSLLLPGETRDDPTSFGPLPGRYAVSVNFERGLDFHMPCPLDRVASVREQKPAVLIPGSTMINNRVPNPYTYFQDFPGRFEPAIGYSILLYEITLADANTWRAKNGLPLLPAENPSP